MSERVSSAVLVPPTSAAIRDELQGLVVADLRGPLGGELEEFGREAPTKRYLLARLAPQGTLIEPDDQDENPGTTSIPPSRRPSQPRRISPASPRPPSAAPST